MLYDRARYEYRGKFAETRFKRDCLAEYAEVFKTVCVDAAYYTFPSQQHLEGMVTQTPDDFLFGLKVTDTITIRKFPKLDRFGERAGKANENYLNADLFVKAFLKPCEAVRASIGLLMFEFSRFWPTDYEHGRDFIADLDRFLGQLPAGWPYGVEMRNRNWLKPEYFECLARHGVTHVFNSWDSQFSVALMGQTSKPLFLRNAVERPIHSHPIRPRLLAFLSASRPELYPKSEPKKRRLKTSLTLAELPRLVMT